MAKKKTTKKIAKSAKKKASKAAKAAKNNSESIEALQSNMFYVAIILGVLMVITLGYNVKMSQQVTEISSVFEGAQVQPTQQQQQQGNDGGNQPTQQAPTVDVDADDDPVKGEADAPVTIIEFSDFQCPFCKRFYDDTLSQIEDEYVDSGQVKIVYRDLPLTRLHPQAMKAAEAAECADEQGMFWEYHDTIFENQGQLSQGDTVLKQWASDLGLNTGDFNECLDSGAMSDEVQSDLQAGQSAGASGTPTFFINGKKLVGAHPFNTFKQAIDAELE